MRAICVDDERALMERTAALCRELPDMEEVTGFTRPREALAWASEHPIDLALLHVEMALQGNFDTIAIRVQNGCRRVHQGAVYAGFAYIN